MNTQTERFIELLRNGKNEQEIIQYYRENEKDIDIHAENDEAFINSCENGYIEVVKLLINLGADIHAENDQAFINSCRNGHIEIVKLLIDLGADIHAQNDQAFINTTINGNKEIVKILLEKMEICKEEENKCLICHFEDKEEMIKLSCNHNYHVECIIKWIKQINACKCPLCGENNTIMRRIEKC